MTADRPSLRTTLLKRVLPVALVVLLGGVAVRVCDNESASWTLDVDLGAASRDVRSFRIELFRGDEADPVAYLDRSFGDGGAHRSERQIFKMGAGDFRAEIAIRTDAGERRLSRTVHASRGKVATVDLEAELLGETPR